MSSFSINELTANNEPGLLLISGPCVVESREMCMRIAEQVKSICDELDIFYVFKASYRKANRSSIDSFTGIGDEAALKIIEEVSQAFDVMTTTDVHTEAEVDIAAEVVDIIQIPAFLCRQTSLLEAASKSGKVVNIKKGQFMSPEAMKYAVEKVRASGTQKILLTERGTTFGYQDLVVDFRSFPIMKETSQVPTIMDCTHSLQKPNQSSGVTGGNPQFIAAMAKAAIAVGADGLFIETHPDPKNAKSDGANMLHLDQLRKTLIEAKKVFDAVQ